MPGDVVVTHTNIYQVLNAQALQIDVVIGQAQAGGTALTLDGAPIAFNNATGHATIGSPGQTLVGSILQCATTVKDINPATNNTSVAYTLSGGVLNKSFPYAVQVSADKGLARYLITFLFTA